MIKYNDKLKVRSGFYEGCIWIAIRQNYSNVQKKPVSITLLIDRFEISFDPENLEELNW